MFEKFMNKAHDVLPERLHGAFLYTVIGVLILLLVAVVFGIMFGWWWCITHFLIVPFVIPIFTSKVITSSHEIGITVILMVLVMIFGRGSSK